MNVYGEEGGAILDLVSILVTCNIKSRDLRVCELF